MWGGCFTCLILVLGLQGLTANEHEGTFKGDKNALKLDCDDSCTTMFTKITDHTLVLVNFMVCKEKQNIEHECPEPHKLSLNLNKYGGEFLIIIHCK